jgi:hypothetical protein
MKKNVSILLIVLLILAISNLIIFAEEAKYDFRKTNWGMSKEQVKATEDKKPDFEDLTTLGYEVKISEKDSLCTYSFLEDKLYRGEYFIIEERSKSVYKSAMNIYIDDYEELKEILTKKYGKPKIDKVVWKDDLYEDDKSYLGYSVFVGDLKCGALWETLTTYIGLALVGGDYDINLAIHYISKELEEWADKTLEEETKILEEKVLKDF